MLTIYSSSARKKLPLVFRALNTRHASIKVAVVGSGPAGFYTTQKLLKNQDIKVDIIEKLPVPFGLVRYGVAPDHADVKNVINSFTNVANNNRVNFYGNINLGATIRLEDLIEGYHAVVLCYGSSQDKLLGIPGEHSKNMISARNFVGWYNGLPEDKDLNVNLDCDTACIIGQGNVALDCARILLRPANLEKTDITSYAQKLIAKSRVRKIYIIGRRGPVQVSFSTKELRELINLNKGSARLEPDNMISNYEVTPKQMIKLSRQRRRLTELLVSLTNGCKKPGGIELVFKFLSKPQRIVANESTNSVQRLELQKTSFDSLESFMDEKSKPQELDEYESIDCGLVIRSIGYKSVMIDKSLPVNYKLGSILNTNGRINGFRSLYCSGWLATGAVGVIAGTLNSSDVTARSILEDIERKELPNITREKLGYKHIESLLMKKAIQVVHFNDWLRIDKMEKQLGEVIGKTREKFVDVDKMLEIAKEKTNEPLQ